MHIAFIDIATAYMADAPLKGPLGGTQAAVCYLGMELARQGVAVTLINQHRDMGEVEGVANLPPEAMDDRLSLGMFSHIVFNGRWTEKIVRGLRTRTGAKFIGWMHEACFQSPYILPLGDMNGFVFVSRWQYTLNKGIVPPNSHGVVIPNGIAPGFHNRKLADKAPIAVYAGSSKRGLLLLPAIIPLIHAVHPELRFEIYADAHMSQNEAENEALRQSLRGLPNVDHVGAIDQNELPARFARATYLLSPNAYPESFCIVMAEAMGAGLRIISTTRAAIPETTHGFAELMPFLDTDNPNWLPNAIKPEAFAAFANNAIADWKTKNAGEKNMILEEEIALAQSRYDWAAHANSWRRFLGNL